MFLDLHNSAHRSINITQKAGTTQLEIFKKSFESKNIVSGTKEGNKVIYTLKDPMIVELLAVARQIFNSHLVDTITILDKFRNEDEEVALEPKK